MKTATDPRHRKRQDVVQSLFSYSFGNYSGKNERVLAIISKIGEIDQAIEKIAPEFPIDKINKVDLAVLRLSIFELVYEKTEPPKVIVDEAVELAKEFGGESSPAFVNGALGNILKDLLTKNETS